MEDLANVVIALTLGIFLVGGATVSHKQTELCAAMGGTFTPQPAVPPFNTTNVCPGGQWINLFRKKPEPTSGKA